MENRLLMRPDWKRWHRLAGFVWLAAFLIWLPFEDTGIQSAIFLAAGVCAWAAVKIASKWRQNAPLWRFAALGLLAGVVIPLFAALTMIFKTGIHAHGFSEYSSSQFRAVLSAIPLAAVIGLILSLAYLRLRKRGGDSL